MKELGAKTPPSPPDTGVLAVATGFKNKIAIKVREYASVSGKVLAENKMPLIA